MALVFVLAALVLLSLLVVGILFTARQEVSSSRAYGAGTDARTLVDLPLNLVTAQIAKATSDPDKAWISQPGLLRTFTAAGQDRVFKLYSSYALEVPGAYHPGDPAVLADEVPDDWAARPREFVDLNRPVDFQNRRIYPIADPQAASLVEGFSFDVGARRPPVASAAFNELPMPVRWIYVTETGEMVGVDDPKRRQAVARIAFWADDESCKVNVNTACGGVFFDMPSVNTREDHMMGRTQPIAQEYQRWPGHPSTTSLAAVLSSLRAVDDPVERSRLAAGLAPRIGWGGSEGGTKYAWLTRELGTTDMDRLYASVDEFAYAPGFAADGMRKPNALANGVELESATEKLDALRFFLTTHSRAPELNLFGRPRITLWPFNEDMVTGATDPRLTPEDRLIRFASELGGVAGDGSLDYSKRKRFYFQRRSAWDPQADWRDSAANRGLFRFLQDMTGRPIPSARPDRAGTATFASKYGPSGRDAILTGMWDYIRSGVNTLNQAYVPVGFDPYSFPPGHDSQTSGFNDVAPLVIDELGTRGLGRHPVLTETILQFVNLGEDFERDGAGVPIDLHQNASPANATPDGIPDHVIRKVRLIVLLNFQMPVSSLQGSEPRFQVRVTGPAAFNFVTNTSLIAPPPAPPLNGSLSPPIQVRNRAAGVLSWADTLAPAGMGFPAAPAAAGFRTVNYLNGYFLGLGYDTVGGPMGPGFGLLTPIRNVSKAGNTQAEINHRLKVLSNRTAFTPPLTDADKEWLDTSSESWSAREDVYYPFVSDVVEFRLPQKSLPSPLPPVIPVEAANANGKDFFETWFSGGVLDIAVYPGLNDAATALSPITANWQAPASGNLLMETSINLGAAVIPLPRRGPELAVNGTTTVTFRQLQNYYNRGGLRYADYLLNVPCKNSTPDMTTQLDVFRSYLLKGSAPVRGDLRLAGLTRTWPSDWWQKHPLYDQRGVFHGTALIAAQQTSAVALDAAGGEKTQLATSGDGPASSSPASVLGRAGRLHAAISSYDGPPRAASPATTVSERAGSAGVGDFSQGFGNTPMGAVVVGPDLGGVSRDNNVAANPATAGPYFSTQFSRAGSDDSATTSGNAQGKNLTGIMYSPFRQIPSPTLFGTLPSRVAGGLPGSWETLLFCPNPAGGRTNHRGWTQAPRDHHLLDLFYMPVVEPYSITENFSTAGKVNLNCQIAPFSYIKRKTALYALLDSLAERSGLTLRPNFPGARAGGSALVTVPESAASGSALRGSSNRLSTAPDTSLRRFVDPAETLKAFDARLDTANDPFVSASEICEMFLAPQGGTGDDAFWAAFPLTGDDKREMPYTHLYPRVTTRSNTFRVHFWVQALNGKLAREEPVVTGEYRGSTIIERYLDPNLTEYGTDVGDGRSFVVDEAFPPLNDKYRFRKIEHQRFSP